MFDCNAYTQCSQRHAFTSQGIINIRNEKWKDDLSPLDEKGTSMWITIIQKPIFATSSSVKKFWVHKSLRYITWHFYLWLVTEARTKNSGGNIPAVEGWNSWGSRKKALSYEFWVRGSKFINLISNIKYIPPGTNNQQPTTNNQQPTTNNQQPTYWVLKILDRYIIRKFLGTFFFSPGIDHFDRGDFWYIRKAGWLHWRKAPLSKIIFDYYFNFIPYFMNLFAYLFVFISVIYFTARLAANTEIVAILNSGISFRRLLYPYFIACSALLSFLFILTDGWFHIPTKLNSLSKINT